MKVLITGGAGYVGTSLCDHLDALNAIEEITVYDSLFRNDRRFFFRDAPYQKVKFIHGDILDTEKLRDACQGQDAVIHLAAFVDEPYHHTQHTQYDQVNAYGTLSVVRAIEQARSISKAFYLSSSAVFGFREDIEPHSPAAPINGYGISKHMGERYFGRLQSNQRQVGIARSGQIFGVNRSMRFDSVIHAFLFEALTNGCVQVYGNGEQSRAFVLVDEVASRLSAWLLGTHRDFELKNEVRLWAAFQGQIGEILNWLSEEVPTVEYRYITPNFSMPSQSFTGLARFQSNFLHAVLTQMQKAMSLPPES